MKRFTETEKWRDTWFRKLPAQVKVAVEYIRDNCDNAGVWEPDYELASFCIGEELDWNAVLTAMGDRVIVLPGGKWYLTHFIEFQYGPLSEACKPHAKVLALLKSHGIPTRVSEGFHIPFPKGIQRDKDQEKEEDKETDQDKAGETPGAAPAQTVAAVTGELGLEATYPGTLDTPEFRAAWGDWLEYRRGRRLPVLQKRSLVAQLARLASWGADAAVQSIRESIAQQWQGLFEPKGGAGAAVARPGANRFQQGAPTADDYRKGFFHGTGIDETTKK